MNLIVDSGSTKTKWRVTEQSKTISEISSAGINPFYMSEDEIYCEISQSVVPHFADFEIKKIFFYGAGCNFAEKKNLVKNAILKNFPLAKIEVESDLLGAARALFGKKSGIACILGTGSNSCFYNGNVIVDNVSPLGYILGDEGSGAVLGKTLIADVLKNQLPEDLIKSFFEEYNITPQEIMENVYRKPFPNRYLAHFAPFLSKNINHESIHNIVYRCFNDFFSRNIMQYPVNEHKIGFIGSVAVAFSETLFKVAETHNVQISKIESCPMNGLVEFHHKLQM